MLSIRLSAGTAETAAAEEGNLETTGTAGGAAALEGTREGTAAGGASKLGMGSRFCLARAFSSPSVNARRENGLV